MNRLIDQAITGMSQQAATALVEQRTESSSLNTTRDGAGATEPTAQTQEAALQELQAILLGSERAKVDALSVEVHQLAQQFEDKEAMAAAIAPVLGNAIRQQIEESQEEIIEALYPIIGQLILRAVTEAVRDLARSIDERMRLAFDGNSLRRWFQSHWSGVSQGELVLREHLPFAVTEIYVIHLESGLLLCHLSQEPATHADADLVSAMLTAIREFAQQVLGRGREQQLHEIRHGDRLILLEFAPTVYVGAVVEGIPPMGFRGELRRRVTIFARQMSDQLNNYQGDSSLVRPAARALFEPMLTASDLEPRERNREER